MEQIRQPRVVHVISDAGPHPYFTTLLETGVFDPELTWVGCVGRAGPLQRDMAALGVRSFALGARSRRDHPRAVVRLARMLGRIRPHVVNAHLVDGCLVGLAAARLARVPLAVMTAHHSHELPFHGWRLRAAERLSAGPLSDHILAPSDQVADVLGREAGVRREKVAIVHHGFDLARLDPSRADGTHVRRELGLEDKLVLGTVGRIFRLKNQAALVRAFAAGPAADPAARLVIAGPGDAAGLRELALELAIADQVVLAGPRNDIPDLLASFDAFVHPAQAESFGMVIVEAMAMARPVLTTPVGIAPEVIEPGITGWLAADTSAQAIAAGLRTMLDARATWERVGSAARRRAGDFSAAGAATATLDCYRRWLAA